MGRPAEKRRDRIPVCHYDVRLRLDDGTELVETFESNTMGLAVHAAERAYPGSVPLAVSSWTPVIGRCLFCRTVIFHGHKFSTSGKATVLCEDCG